MKSVRLIALFSLSTFFLHAQATEGITFIKENFEEALKKAKLENKMIFMDAYTTWCGPCKMMVKNTFTDPNVAEYYNENFVNVKVDMEKGVGPKLLKQYGIVAFPTLLFLNPEGELMHKALGYHDADQFLALGETAMDAENSLANWNQRYEKGERDPEFLKAYAEKLAEAYEARRSQIADEYLATQKDWKTEENLTFIYQFTEGVSSKTYKFLVDNRKDFEKVAEKTEIDAKIQGFATDFLYDEKNPPSPSAADSVIRLAFGENAPRMSAAYSMDLFKLKKDYAGYVQAATQFFAKNKGTVDEYWNAAMTVFESVDDKSAVKKAVSWAKSALKMEKTVDNALLIAQLYQKLGKTSKAKSAAKKAVEIAKATNAEAGEAEAFLKNLK